jgi:outer membrane protein TolC
MAAALRFGLTVRAEDFSILHWSGILQRGPHRAREGYCVRRQSLLLLAAMACAAPITSAMAQVPGQTTPPPPADRAAPPSRAPVPGALGSFLGGVPTGEATKEPVSLSISDAINRALQYNLGLLLTQQGIDSARAARFRTLAELLPDINGHVTEARQVVNLAAFGFPLPAGIPPIVGPFNTFDARVTLSQSILDFKARNDSRAGTHNLAAAQYDYRSARDLVVLVATVSYAQALAASARVDAADAQVQTAQALLTQAMDLKQNGLVAGIDVLRADVQLQTDRQRTTSARNELEKSKLQLARLIGLPLGQSFTLTTELAPVNIPEMTLDQAVERAYRTRPDYLAALERVKAAEATQQAAAGESLPSVRVNANYGVLGLTVSDAHSTYTVAGTVDIPIFQGGRERGRRLDAETDLRRRRTDADDLKGAIYYEVRTAMLDLQTGNEQLEVASRARMLAADELTQARDRFAAGVADNIEVVQAQAAVTLANDQYISALYTTSLAKGSLVRAVGIAEETARDIFGGLR